MDDFILVKQGYLFLDIKPIKIHLKIFNLVFAWRKITNGKKIDTVIFHGPKSNECFPGIQIKSLTYVLSFSLISERNEL